MVKNFKLVAEPGKQDIVATFEIDSPLEKVFKAYTNAEAVKQWWGGGRYETTVDKFDPQAGGSWRLVQEDPDGNVFAFHGVYHEVEENERITWTFEFEGLPEKGHISLETVYFTRDGDVTKVRNVSVFQSVADRDGMVAAGMEEGFRSGLDVLSEVAKKL